MNQIVGCHVIDRTNIGDLLSSPLIYFPFEGFSKERFDVRDMLTERAKTLSGKHIILGGGGLVYKRFFPYLNAFKEIENPGKVIAWGVGQQQYDVMDDSKEARDRVANFDYSIIESFDLLGIRDFGFCHPWVPCVSCMHEEFDRPRQIEHEFVVFSHKKFLVEVENLPRETNATADLKSVLDFLGSGETVITSSFHGAYWATLLGRQVIAFPFSSKFHTLKHAPAIYPVRKWYLEKKWWHRFAGVREKRFRTDTSDWRDLLQHCRSHPESLEECREQNRKYYQQAMETLRS